MDKKKKLLLSKIATSKSEVADAEKQLTKVLSETQNGPRAEKTQVTETLKDALAKLRAARIDLEDLDRLISEKD